MLCYHTYSSLVDVLIIGSRILGLPKPRFYDQGTQGVYYIQAKSYLYEQEIQDFNLRQPT